MRIQSSIYRGYIIIAIFFAMIAVFGASDSVQAQTATGTPEFLFSVLPPDAGVGDTVTATIIPTNFTAAEATIRWFIDDNEQPSETGKTTFVFPAPSSQSGFFDVGVSVTVGEATESRKTRIIINTVGSPENIYENLRGFLQNLETQYGPSDAPLFEPKAPANAPFSIVSDIQFPRPFNTVNLHIESFAFNPNTVRIEWLQNGRRVAEGIGQTSFSFQLGALGSQSTITARAFTEGKTYETSVTFTPFFVSLYSWADTTVPFWYRGKSLATRGNTVRVAAFVPAGVPEPKNIIYQWSLNGRPQPNASGLGKQVFSFRPFLPGLPDVVSVTIKNTAGTLAFESSLTIRNVSPEVHVCVVQLISGCVKGALSTEARPGESVDIQASPFFFGKDELSFLRYEWSIAGQMPTQPATTRPSLLTVKIPPNIRGIISVTLSIGNGVSALSARRQFDIFAQ